MANILVFNKSNFNCYLYVHCRRLCDFHHDRQESETKEERQDPETDPGSRQG